MTKQIEPRILKGFRDFLPEEAIVRKQLIEKIRRVFESYGFDPIETPALEYLEVFQGNIGEDEKLFYHFQDHGGREVALRYDQTVPTCRFVAQHQHLLPMPFKRYQIQPVWRADKPQKGRYREFVQCDFDIFGVESPLADAETIAMTIDVYKAIGFSDFTVHLSDRALYEGISYPVIAAIDKLDKIGADGVIAEIVSKGHSQQEAEKMLQQVFDLQPNQTLETIFDYLRAAGFEERYFKFDATLARSFSYSTGPIWEVKIGGFSGGSVGGGERYDQLTGRFSKKTLPATGIAVGFDRTIDALRELDLIQPQKTLAQVLVTVFSPELLPHSLKLAAELRKAGIRVDSYTDPTVKLGRQLSYADSKGIPFALVLGPDEVAEKTVVLKDLAQGDQSVHVLSAVAEQLKQLLA